MRGMRNMLPLSLMLVMGCAGTLAGSEDDPEPVGRIDSPLKSEGERLFFDETFGGNGRACGTCHSKSTGTLSPSNIEALYAKNPNGPLFQHDGADTPGGSTFQRLRTRATVRIDLPLPPNVSIVGSSARTVSVFRGIPTTMNVPALDPVLMADGRAPTLQAQARDAIFGHAQSSQVTSPQLDAIASFEKTLFNNGRLRRYASGGAPPALPPGNTPSEKRGRVFFADDNPANGNPVAGRCVHCHSGPMLDETSPGFQLLTGVPAGTRFFSAFVSELNPGGDAQQTFRFQNADGTTTDVVSADPGLALITGDAANAHQFKIPTIWGAKKTAPYFHDNSAADIPAMLEHYDQYFNIIGFDLTEQDKLDIAAYMQLL